MKRFRTATSVFFGLCAGAAPMTANAADLFRHRHHHIADAGIYREDYACPIDEPRVYKPRVVNYNEPLCYAARPYGISTHLYDRSSDLARGITAASGY